MLEGLRTRLSAGAGALIKALASDGASSSTDANVEGEGIAPTVTGGNAVVQKAWEIDPYDLDTLGDFDEMAAGDRHPGTLHGLPYSVLDRMARVDVPAAIIETRINQIASFCEPHPEEGQLGYKVQLRDRSATPTDEDIKRANWLTDYLYNCGDARAVGYDDDFESFTRRVGRDSLIFDQANFEVLRTRLGVPAGIVAVDAKTIRRCIPTPGERAAGHYSNDPDAPAFVQIMEYEKVETFSYRDMAFGVRRPRTSIESNRYGYPELEILTGVITSILHAEAYNAQNFTHGMHSAGILALKSKMDKKTFKNFRRQFYGMMSGAYNAKRTPVLQLNPENEDIQAINFSSTNREMEYKEWLAFLQKITCAIYQIDPAELGFVYGAEGQTSSLSQQGPEARVQFSREKGLRPFIRAYAKWLNRWFLHPLDPRFEVVFVGLEDQLNNSKLDRIKKKVDTFMTVNEARAEMGMKPLDNPAADLVLNPQYVNAALSGGAGDVGSVDEIFKSRSADGRRVLSWGGR